MAINLIGGFVLCLFFFNDTKLANPQALYNFHINRLIALFWCRCMTTVLLICGNSSVAVRRTFKLWLIQCILITERKVQQVFIKIARLLFFQTSSWKSAQGYSTMAISTILPDSIITVSNVFTIMLKEFHAPWLVVRLS